MSKIILILIFTLSSLFSQEDTKFPFVGIGTSAQTMNLDLQNNNENTFLLRYGQQTLDWRASIAYEFKNSDYQSLSVEIDKILLDDLFGTAKLRPYLGLSVGILKYKKTLLDDTDGFYYGGNGGFIIYLTDTIDLDLSYHYNVVQDIKTLDSMQGATLSLHYFY
ncbi:MAG: hypothetical protein COB07_07945 [Sulfurovum sp.]|nr:MAG: hypothetical protein COB07_07945 [Sulfurovum sp.]